MEYTSVEDPDGGEVRIPVEHAEDDDRRRAHAWLRRLAAPHYNRMLAAEREGRIPEALAAARSATRYGAFVPRIVTSAFLVATRHGDFDLAQQLLNRLRALGVDDTDDYASLLRRRVERWNALLDDTDLLRETYQQGDVSSSYRELLLLADRLDGPPTETERAYLRAVGLEGLEAGTRASAPAEAPAVSRSATRLVPALVVACLVGIGLGGGGMYLTSSNGEPEVETTEPSTTIPDSLVPQTRYATALRVSTLLAEGRSVKAHRALDRLAPDGTPGKTIDSLRVATREALYRTGTRAWEAEDHERIVEALAPIRNAEVGNAQDRRYRLGVAAAQIGRDTLAADVLQDLMPTIDEEHPHYEAQAAYLLVERGPPGVARRHARLIADKYANTIYFNSVVRSQLDESE